MSITLSLKCGRVHFLWRCRLRSGNFNVLPGSQYNGTHIPRILHRLWWKLVRILSLAWFSSVAICPIWFVKVWIEALVSCWNCIFWRVIILTNSSNEVEKEGAGATIGASVGTGGTGAACAGAALCCGGGGFTFWNCWGYKLPWFPHLKLGWFLHPGLYLFVDKSWFCCWCWGLLLLKIFAA